MRNLFAFGLIGVAGAAACGGSSGGTVTPSAQPARLTAAAVEIPANAQTAPLLVSLAGEAQPGPALVEVAVELPPQLTLPADDRLQPARPLVTLDGDFVGNRFVVLCGDGENLAAAALADGPLFRLRLQATSPRQPGDYTVTLRNLRAATAAGDEVEAVGAALVVPVTIR